MKQVAEASPVDDAQAASEVQASQFAPAHPAEQTPEPARVAAEEEADAAARSEAEALQVQVSPVGVLPWKVEETPAAAASDDVVADEEEDGAWAEAEGPSTEPSTGASPEALEIIDDEGAEAAEEAEERGFFAAAAEALGGAAGAAGGSASAGQPEAQGAHSTFSSFCWQLGPEKPQRHAHMAEAASPGGRAQRPLAPHPPSEEEASPPEEEEQPSTAEALSVAESQTRAEPSDPSLRVNLGRKVMLSLLSVR